MQSDEFEIPGLLALKSSIFKDDRGFFFESWNSRDFADAVGEDIDFVQDNHSGSNRHVLRGLHYQVPPHAQGKLVRAVRGAIFDVAVDIRRGSSTFGQWVGVELTEENKKQLWIPPGFAHGFVALTDWAEILYKASAFYSAEHDRSIRWDDPNIGIEWPLDTEPVLSDKDRSAPLMRDAETFA